MSPIEINKLLIHTECNSVADKVFSREMKLLGELSGISKQFRIYELVIV